MLDKFSRKILKYVRKNPEVGESNFNAGVFAIPQGISTDSKQVRAAVNYLEKSGLIAYRRNGKGMVTGFRLSHVGFHQSELTAGKILENWADRIISFILGVLATIVAQIIIEWISK